MGGIVSSILGGGSSSTDSSYEDGDANPAGVVIFHSSNRWQLHFNEIKGSNKLLVVDFAAVWCGPCKMMEPVVNGMASTYTNVSFAKIDVDELPDVAKENEVQAMPTFVLFKGGREVDRVIGAKKDELERKIKKHQSS